MAAENTPSEIIEKQRKTLLKILQQDPDSVLDSLASRRLISEEEYETLEKVSDPMKKSRKLLILVQKKGEVSCQCFLQCFFTTFPESAVAWDLRNEFFKQDNIAPPQPIGVSKTSRDTFSPGKNKAENPEREVSSKEKEHLDLEISKFFRDKETALSSSRNEKEYDTPKVILPYSTEKAECEMPETIIYLKDGQRYEEADDSLYLGREEYQEYVGHTEGAKTTVEEGESDDSEHTLYDGKEDPEHSEAMRFSEEEHVYEDPETSILLEEEEELMEERKKVFKDVLSRLNMDRSRKLLPDFVKQFSLEQEHGWTPKTTGDLAWNFLMKIQALDMTARDAVLRHRALDEDSEKELLTRVENLEIRDIHTMNPLDVICASLLCSASSLQCEVMTNMYKCQFALPLLLPDVENNRCLLMLGAMKDIVKKQLAQSSGMPMGDPEKLLHLTKMPIISFVRLGHCSFSKSGILNTLLSPAQIKPHKIFLHRDLSVPGPSRQISGGLVEMAWCIPAGDESKENLSVFQKPIALANLRGDLESFWTQFGFLMEISSAVFFFTDSLGEKEWDLLMFLGEAAIERCYFVLSPKARKSEEAELFQKILKLQPAQLLFWEGEETGDRKESLEGLQAAIQEVMASSLRYVSLEEMASLARELGIQVDQDFENAQGIRVSLSEHMAVTAEGEGIPRHSQLESSPESQALMPGREPQAGGQVSQNLQVYPSPASMPHLGNSWSLPARVRGNSNHVSFKDPQIVGSHFGSERRSKWFCPLPFWNTRAHNRGRSFGIKYFQPQRFYSGPRFVKISSTSHGHHFNGTIGRPPRPLSQHVWSYPERPQTARARSRSRVVVSHLSHSRSWGSQPAGTERKPQPGQTRDQETQLTEATGKSMHTIFHNTDPHHQSSQPAAIRQKLARPASQQGAQLLVQGRPESPAFLTGSHPMSKSKLLSNSQFKSHQSKPPQVKNFQPRPSHPTPSQPKPSQTKPSRPLPSQAKPSQPKLSQPRPTQPKSSQASPSQASANQPRAGAKRAGKH